MFGGRVIVDAGHQCPVPKVGRVISHAVGTVWECSRCGRRWQVALAGGRKTWVERGQETLTRAVVLDRVAQEMCSWLAEEDVALARLNIHTVLETLERIGLASWTTK